MLKHGWMMLFVSCLNASQRYVYVPVYRLLLLMADLMKSYLNHCINMQVNIHTTIVCLQTLSSRDMLIFSLQVILIPLNSFHDPIPTDPSPAHF